MPAQFQPVSTQPAIAEKLTDEIVGTQYVKRAGHLPGIRISLFPHDIMNNSSTLLYFLFIITFYLSQYKKLSLFSCIAALSQIKLI